MDAFCEHLEPEEILPYVPQLVETLMVVLQGGRPGVQEFALSAVSSIAAAAQGSFQPYTGVVVQEATRAASHRWHLMGRSGFACVLGMGGPCQDLCIDTAA